MEAEKKEKQDRNTDNKDVVFIDNNSDYDKLNLKLSTKNQLFRNILIEPIATA